MTGDLLEHQSLPDAVLQLLRRRILNNEMVSGERLVEASLASELNVSRTTIRAAMRELAAEGLIEIIPRRHSVVTRMSAEASEDLCFARYVLEAGIARSLPPRVRKELEVPLREVLDDMDAASEAGDVQRLIECDTRFHGLIVHISTRKRSAEMWTGLNSQMGALVRSSIDRHRQIDFRGIHEPIVDALVNGSTNSIDKVLRQHYLADTSKYSNRIE
jgi:DNA-binding GntR family transcriptional regulator